MTPEAKNTSWLAGKGEFLLVFLGFSLSSPRLAVWIVFVGEGVVDHEGDGIGEQGQPLEDAQ